MAGIELKEKGLEGQEGREEKGRTGQEERGKIRKEVRADSENKGTRAILPKSQEVILGNEAVWQTFLSYRPVLSHG